MLYLLGSTKYHTKQMQNFRQIYLKFAFYSQSPSARILRTDDFHLAVAQVKEF